MTVEKAEVPDGIFTRGNGRWEWLKVMREKLKATIKMDEAARSAENVERDSGR